MRISKLFTKTRRAVPRDEKSTNAILLQRAGYIHKEIAGVYSFLPLGLRVIKKIEEIIRKEMYALGAQEIFMSALQPRELWQKTGRWEQGIGKEVMYKCKQDKTEVGLGPTHEEMLTNIVKEYLESYHDLPIYLFQMQTKFRKELRAKSGILRTREFIMKDLYSFHESEDDFRKYYEKVKQVYSRIFKQCGLETIITEASGAGFTGGYTHEFQVLSENGEDEIVFCPRLHFSQNTEISKLREGEKCPRCEEALEKKKSIEVGNIFPLGTRYSEKIGAYFTDRNGKKKPVVMGSYGIGISRLMGAIVEVSHDDKGIIWPESVTPYRVHLLGLQSSDDQIDEDINRESERIYRQLKESQIEVIFDDRKKVSAGEKFADADLLGIPYRLVISESTLAKKGIEIKKRGSEDKEIVKLDKVINFFNSK